MRILISISILAASAVFAQAPAAKPDPAAAAADAAKSAVEKDRANTPAGKALQVTVPAAGGSQSIPMGAVMSILAMKPEQLVATIDGSKVTAGDLQAILRALPPQAQQQALANRQAFLQQYGMMRRLSSDAEKAKLDEESPWKEQLANIKMQMLANAAINQKLSAIQIPVEEQQKYYDKNKADYAQAKVKAIYIPFSAEPVSQSDGKGKKVMTEEEAKAKAGELVKQLRGGADFVKAVKENSGDPTSAAKDGDFGTIRKLDRIPEAVKTAVFAAKKGDITDPVRQASGFYVFRIEEAETQSLDQVKDSISNELKNAQFSEWMNALQKSIEIKEEAITMTMEQIDPPSAGKAGAGMAPSAIQPAAPKAEPKK